MLAVLPLVISLLALEQRVVMFSRDVEWLSPGFPNPDAHSGVKFSVQLHTDSVFWHDFFFFLVTSNI